MAKDEKTIAEQFEEMWTGLGYHVRDLAKFMVEHSNDPFFETDDGKVLEKCSAKIVGEHTRGLLTLLIMKEEK